MEYGLRWIPGSSRHGRDHRSCTPHGYATSLQKYPVSRCEIRGRLTNRTSDQKNCSRKHFRVIRYCVRNVGLVVFRTYEAAEIALYHALGSLPMPQGTHEGENLYKKQFKSNSLLRSRAPLNRAISSTWEYTYASGHPRILTTRRKFFQEGTLE